jgi:uncharacterized membrane protein YjfL (UPF0719 family)
MLLQVLPPIPGTTGPDWASFGWNVLFAVLWTIVAVLCFSIAIPIALRLFSWMTPGIDEMQELRNGNRAVGILLASFVLSMTLLVIAILLK